MANRFLSNIKINDAYTFPASDGSNGQVITTDGSGNLSFADPSTSSSASIIYRDNFTGDGTTTAFTLQNSLSDEDQTFIYIDGVYQEKDNYSLNTDVITFTTAPESGHSVEVISISGINVGPTTIYQDNFTGDGVETEFNMAQSVDNEVKTMIYFNGVYQFKGTYTVNGTLITFDTAPSNGVNIEVISIASAAAGEEAYSQELLFYGKASGAISKGDAVMFAGSEGDHFLFARATQAAIEANHEYLIGLATQDLANNEYGYVTEFGNISSLDTSGYTAGDILWFDAGGTTAGALTTTEPAAPLAKIQVAAVIRSHQNEGVIFVRPTWFHSLDELHDVNITSVADKDLLVWNDTEGYWENSKTVDTLTANTFVKSGGTSSEFLKADGSIDSNVYLTTESDTLQSVVSRGSSVANTITIDGGNFEIFNTSFTDRRLTVNQSSGAIPRIYNFDQVASSFHAIKIGGGNDDNSGLLIGDGSDPTVTIFNPFSINSGTNYNDKGYIYLSNQRSAIISDIVNLTSNGDTSLDFQTRSGGTTSSSMFIDEFRRVGIGTTSPSQKLDVRGNIKIDGANNGNVANFIMTRTDASWRIANETDFRIYSGGGNTDAAGNLRMQINSAGNTSFTGSVSSDSDVRSQRLVLRSDALERWEGTGDDKAVTINYFGYNTTFDYYRDLNIYNGKGGFIATFDGSSSNVGIGTTTPYVNLTIKDSDSQTTTGLSEALRIAATAQAVGNKKEIGFSPYDSGAYPHITLGMVYTSTASYCQSDFYITTRGTTSNSAPTERFRITGGGNVGIGTTDPKAKLHTNQNLQGSLLSYLNGTSTTFDGDANLLAVHNSPSIGNATAAGLVLANNDKSVNAISPIIAFSAKSDSNTYNHTYAAIYGTRTGAGADSNWTVGDLVFATNYNTGPLERVRIKGGTGNVGINHTNPGHKLHINNSSVGSTFTKAIKLSCSPAVDGGNAIFFKTSGNDADDRYGVKLGAVRSVASNGSSEFIIQMESTNMAGMENVFRINREKRVIIGEATGYDGDLASRNGWVLNYTGGGGTTCNFSGSNEIFNFNQRDGQGTTQIDFRNGNVERGRIEWTTSATTYNTTSDYRLKENVTSLSNSLSKLSLLEPKQFNFISDPEDVRIGFIAHEVQDVVPQAVSGEKDAVREDGTPKYQGLDHSMLVPLLVGAIKEQQSIIEDLKARIETLENN
jgi:hypothetical protein